MTVISLIIKKTDESTDWVKYAFGNPPYKVLGNVILYKETGEIELLDLKNSRSKYALKFVMRRLEEHYEQHEFPEITGYSC